MYRACNSAANPKGDYALETMARDLQSVVDQTGDSPALLIGHSIGGMINLTFCRVSPTHLGQPVKGIVQLNTSYTNPVKTTPTPEPDQALQKPVYEPLLHAIVFLSPVVRVLNWLSYQSGLTHLQNASQSFAGTETREQLDFASRYQYESSPSVVARGVLGMLHWDATEVLPRVGVPVLIVTGEQDKTTVPAASQVMAKSIPGARLLSVSPAAHLGPIEQNRRYNTAIREFARGVLSQ
ncbi:MAG: alpha/beta hydrolase [Bryobacteraceae bacterium]